MKHFRHSARQTQQVFAALALTSIVSLGSGVNLVNAAIAKSTEPVQGSVSEPLKLSSKDVASPKQLGNREIPVSVVNAVRREISSSYRIPPGQLKIVSYSSERWSDSCLGLGKPNESCAKVLIENGWRVVMSDSRQTWTYRTDGIGRIVRLETQGNSNSSNLPDSVADAVLRAASDQLGVPRSQLKIVKAQQQNWPDRCLGLPSPVELCASALTPGWQVVVESKQQRLVYHSDRTGSQIRLNKRESNINEANLPQSVADAVLRTASGRTGLRISELRIIKSKQITTDGCLSLPRPGEACTRIAQQAWEVTVDAGKQRLVYRSNQNGSQIRLNEAASSISDTNLPQSIGNAVLRFAAKDLGVSASQLRITKAEQQTWGDSCLGLPRPTERCMGTPTPGWRVAVESQQRVQVYRTDTTGERIRAEEVAGQPQAGNLPASVSRAVLQDAATRTNLSTSGLRIVQSERRDWPDGCLGLPTPGQGCTMAVVSGWRVTVEAGRQTLVYRTNESGSLVKLEGGGFQGNSGAIQIPRSELPPPLAEGVVFRAIASGGITGGSYETVLMNDGRVIRQFSNPIIKAPAQMHQISRQEVRQFQQLLEQQQFSQFNQLGYPAPRGAADYITVTLSSQSSTTRYVDMGSDRLPQPLRAVIESWSQIANRR